MQNVEFAVCKHPHTASTSQKQIEITDLKRKGGQGQRNMYFSGKDKSIRLKNEIRKCIRKSRKRLVNGE